MKKPKYYKKKEKSKKYPYAVEDDKDWDYYNEDYTDYV